jgi:pectate lyase
LWLIWRNLVVPKAKSLILLTCSDPSNQGGKAIGDPKMFVLQEHANRMEFFYNGNQAGQVMKKDHSRFLLLLSSFVLSACGYGQILSSSILGSSQGNDVSSGEMASSGSSLGASSIEGNSSTEASSSQSSSSFSSSQSSSDGDSASENSSSGIVINPVQGAVDILESGGLFESAYVEWEPLENATGYNVFYQKTGDSSWSQLDNELIRRYPAYWRADAVGLPQGQYLMKVTPIDGEGVKNSSSSTTGSMTVQPHHRDGYAFKDGTASGAYNSDGSLKSNAMVVYVTNDTVNTVSGSLALDGKGTIYHYSGIQDIFYAFTKGYEKRPLDIRFLGDITSPVADGVHTSNKGDFLVELDGKGKYTAGITIEGIGNDAVFNGFGVRVKGVTNLELRNFAVMNCDSTEGDNIGLQQDNDYVWIHNCDLFYGMAGSDADQIKGDGAMDCKNTNHVTMSYLHFWDSGKSSLLGMTDTAQAGYFVTYDHNWFDHSDSRHPRARLYTAHVYSNYFDGNAKYGIGAALSSNVFAENNYFRNCKYPMLTSLQGSDVLDDPEGEGTFSGEAGGFIKAFNNVVIGQGDFRPYDSVSNPIEFDAYVVSSRDETIPSAVTAKSGGQVYKNNDTNGNQDPVDLLTEPQNVPAFVKSTAGRLEGGDFAWTFTDADDTSYDVNAGLKAAIVAYQGSLVSVGGGSLL